MRRTLIKYISPDCGTIKNTNAGNAAAMQKLLVHYNAYIMFFTTYNGAANYVYAEEIKVKLMKAVLKIDIDR